MLWGKRLLVLSREVAGIVAGEAPHQLVQQEEQGPPLVEQGPLLVEEGPWALAVLVPHKLDRIRKTVFALRVFRRDVARTSAEMSVIGAVTLPSAVFVSKVDRSGFVRWLYSHCSVEVLKLCRMGSDRVLSIQHQLRTIC